MSSVTWDRSASRREQTVGPPQPRDRRAARPPLGRPRTCVREVDVAEYVAVVRDALEWAELPGGFEDPYTWSRARLLAYGLEDWALACHADDRIGDARRRVLHGLSGCRRLASVQRSTAKISCARVRARAVLLTLATL